jgi:hypothetical protein
MGKWTKKPSNERPWMKYYPKGTNRELDYELMAVDEIVKRNARLYPTQDAIYFYGFRMSMAELDKCVISSHQD